jgi:hypothetical protein
MRFLRDEYFSHTPLDPHDSSPPADLGPLAGELDLHRLGGVQIDLDLELDQFGQLMP